MNNDVKPETHEHEWRVGGDDGPGLIFLDRRRRGSDGLWTRYQFTPERAEQLAVLLLTGVQRTRGFDIPTLAER